MAQVYPQLAVGPTFEGPRIRACVTKALLLPAQEAYEDDQTSGLTSNENDSQEPTNQLGPSVFQVKQSQEYQKRLSQVGIDIGLVGGGGHCSPIPTSTGPEMDDQDGQQGDQGDEEDSDDSDEMHLIGGKDESGVIGKDLGMAGVELGRVGASQPIRAGQDEAPSPAKEFTAEPVSRKATIDSEDGDQSEQEPSTDEESTTSIHVDEPALAPPAPDLAPAPVPASTPAPAPQPKPEYVPISTTSVKKQPNKSPTPVPTRRSARNKPQPDTSAKTVAPPAKPKPQPQKVTAPAKAPARQTPARHSKATKTPAKLPVQQPSPADSNDEDQGNAIASTSVESHVPECSADPGEGDGAQLNPEGDEAGGGGTMPTAPLPPVMDKVVPRKTYEKSPVRKSPVKRRPDSAPSPAKPNPASVSSTATTLAPRPVAGRAASATKKVVEPESNQFEHEILYHKDGSHDSDNFVTPHVAQKRKKARKSATTVPKPATVKVASKAKSNSKSSSSRTQVPKGKALPKRAPNNSTAKSKTGSSARGEGKEITSTRERTVEPRSDMPSPDDDRPEDGSQVSTDWENPDVTKKAKRVAKAQHRQSHMAQSGSTGLEVVDAQPKTVAVPVRVSKAQAQAERKPATRPKRNATKAAPQAKPTSTSRKRQSTSLSDEEIEEP